MRFSFALASLIALTSTCFAESPSESTLAVQTAARHYRMEIYDRFRESREQYDQWRAVGDMLVEHWTSAGQPDAWNDELTHWFNAATEASRNQGQLPQLPDLMPVANEAPAGDDVQTVIPADTHPITSEQPAATESLPPSTETPTETATSDANSEETTSDEAASDEAKNDDVKSDDAAPAAAPASEESANDAKDAKVLEAIGGAFWRAIAE